MQTIITEAEENRYAELQRMALDFARQGDTETLEAMLRHGLPLNLADDRGNTLLLLASYHGHAQTTRMLLGHGADVDRRNDHGQTPLGGVAFKGYQEIAALLLQHGADIDADNGVGEQLQAHGASLRRRNRLGISARWMVRISRWLGRFFRCPAIRPGAACRAGSGLR
jgi:ankyrin repeat protein